MPNRIIKESAFTSDKIAQLSDFEFRLWVGLITQADDAGRGDARAAIIKGRVFALRDRTTNKDIDDALHKLAAYGCVSLYTVGGKPYYAFPNWAAHQRVRDVKPRYPGPDEADDFDSLPQSAANCGESRPKSNPIQSEIESESKSESKSNTRAREDVGEAVAFYEKGAGVIAIPSFIERLTPYLDSLGLDIVIHGIEAAFGAGKTAPNYVIGVLRRYQRDGLDTLDKIERSERKFELEQKQKGSSGKKTAVAKQPDEYKGADFFDDG